jgi:hypothetical protein
MRHIVENRAAVSATVIPAQTLTTNVTQNITGDVCSNSIGRRSRYDQKEFSVEGRLNERSYDV